MDLPQEWGSEISSASSDEHQSYGVISHDDFV